VASRKAGHGTTAKNGDVTIPVAEFATLRYRLTVRKQQAPINRSRSCKGGCDAHSEAAFS